MCGIFGIVERDPARTVSALALGAMMDASAHRGPDDRGVFVDGPVGLACCRLSIVDPAGGHQPVPDEARSAWVVHNGEIYNHLELRPRLEAQGHRLASKCDTEVLVHLYEELGADCVRPLNGMFAFAVWDRRRRSLLLARDRLGVKPLFYAALGDRFVFASELKSILALPDAPREVDPQALHDYLSFRYVPGPGTILKGIFKLLPGQTLTWRDDRITLAEYWDLGYGGGPVRADGEWGEELGERLRGAVSRQLMSDVPLGVLLSGGIDSTSIVALMEALDVGPVSTFSIGFPDDPDGNELPFARLAADRFRTRHHELTMDRDQFLEDLPGAVWHMDEPVADPAGIPLMRLARAARQAGVVVLLSGEGGDEVFGGYAYWKRVRSLRLARAVGALPKAARAPLLKVQEALGRLSFIRMAEFPEERLRLYSLSWIFSEDEKRALYAGDFAAASGRRPSERVLDDCTARAAGADELSRLLYGDTKLWLPDDLLVKADRMTMAASVELRVPFLDHTLVEFAASMPSHLKSRPRRSKLLFKRVMGPLVPPEILARPKAGFPVPLGLWRRGRFMDFVSDTLLSTRAVSRGYFNRDVVASLVARHRAGEAGLSTKVFVVLFLELWCRQYLDACPRSS
jgi:asparagine synthase (glutamine-hydrolysing)